MENQTDDRETPSLIDGQLAYIGQNVTEIPLEILQNFSNTIKRLDLSFNCLQKLDGLESLTNLEELILDNNDLEEVSLPNLPHLHTLTLNKNKIRELDRLLDQIEKHVQNLTYLSLLGNEACPNQLSSSERDEDDYARYRLYVIYRLPKLKFLDSTAVTPGERKEAEQHGSFLRVVRPPDTVLKDPESASPDQPAYSPLPNFQNAPGLSNKAIYGKCRYIYHGRHSEGNRFIRNNDL